MNKEIGKYNSYGGQLDLLMSSDYHSLIESGRKPYYVNRKYELVEVSSFGDKELRDVQSKMTTSFKKLLFLENRYVDAVNKLVINLGELDESYKREIELRFMTIEAKLNEERKK